MKVKELIEKLKEFGEENYIVSIKFGNYAKQRTENMLPDFMYKEVFPGGEILGIVFESRKDDEN